ncbi:putative PIF1 DNA helicase/replication protein A1-like protein [Tanacetum coccineum]
MSYQKTPTLSSNNYKKNVGVGGSGSFGGSSDGTPKTTNKRKANEIRAMISTNIAPLIDFSIRKRGRASQPMTPGATSLKQDILYPGNSFSLASDMHNLKGKRLTRQSLRTMKSTHPERQGEKNAHKHGLVGISKDYIDHGDPTFPCESCGALLWHAETLRRATDALDESNSICCSRGKVTLGIFHDGVTNYDEKNKGTRVTMKEWFSYRVQERENEFSMMLNGRRLFQQFLVDGYTMIEAERMSFNRKQQKELRSETNSKLAKLAEDPESGVQLRGKKVVLSSSFTGSPRRTRKEPRSANIISRIIKVEQPQN